MIVNLRVDERLVHGQVVTSWTKTLGITHLVIANDIAANDKIQAMSLKMSVPSGIKCMVATLQKAAEILNDPRSEGFKVMVICNSPKDACQMAKTVPAIQNVNLANYGYIIKPKQKGKVNLTGAVACDEEDMESVHELAGMVKDFYSQILPTNPKKVLDSLKKE